MNNEKSIVAMLSNPFSKFSLRNTIYSYFHMHQRILKHTMLTRWHKRLIFDSIFILIEYKTFIFLFVFCNLKVTRIYNTVFLGLLHNYMICIVTWKNDWILDDPVILVSSFCVPLHSLRSRGARKWNSCQLRKGKNTLLLV